MKKAVLIAGFCLMIPVSASAQSVGNCGWGSKLFDGQRGIAPQVLAVTTNGTSGNQTFGISSGTSGCMQDGVVNSAWQTAMYIDSNASKIARDMSVGHGESLEALASLLGMNAEDTEHFMQVSKSEFSVIFPRADVSSKEIVASLKGVLKNDSQLSVYSAQL